MAQEPPNRSVAIHGVRTRGWTAPRRALTGSGHALSRAELKMTRPTVSADAITALKIATATPRLTAVFIADPTLRRTTSSSGADELTRCVSEPDPRTAAVAGAT